MPGKFWSNAEKRTLCHLRRAGIPVPEIVADPDVLPGRTADAIRQLLRRQGWVNEEASERAKAIVKLDGEQHLQFIVFLRKYSTAPLAQLASSWNSWAKPQGWPQISDGMAWYWIEKLHLPHDRKTAWNSQWSKKKRRLRRNEAFNERMQELTLETALELAQRQKSARKYRKSHPKCDRHICGNCENVWPLAEDFFPHLPNVFIFGGGHLIGYQTEFCTFCDWNVDRALLILRAHGRSVDSLVAGRKAQRRKGIDAAFDALKAEAVRKARRLLKRSKTSPRRTCVRCEVEFPLNRTHFRENRGNVHGATYRALCVFCDHHYETALDRLKRDGRDRSGLLAERESFLALAREKLRKERRVNARLRCRDLLERNPSLKAKRCAECLEPWLVNRRYAAEFWHVGTYVSRTTGAVKHYTDAVCIFCKSDRQALQRREVRKE